ncbi:hypothetical protein GGI35DRAFT_447776 [Trichoderma velutinum]
MSDDDLAMIKLECLSGWYMISMAPLAPNSFAGQQPTTCLTPSNLPLVAQYSATPCLETYQVLQTTDQLRGIGNWDSSDARALQLASHINGSARRSLLMPHTRRSYANTDARTSVLI